MNQWKITRAKGKRRKLGKCLSNTWYFSNMFSLEIAMRTALNIQKSLEVFTYTSNNHFCPYILSRDAVPLKELYGKLCSDNAASCWLPPLSFWRPESTTGAKRRRRLLKVSLWRSLQPQATQRQRYKEHGWAMPPKPFLIYTSTGNSEYLRFGLCRIWKRSSK